MGIFGKAQLQVLVRRPHGEFCPDHEGAAGPPAGLPGHPGHRRPGPPPPVGPRGLGGRPSLRPDTPRQRGPSRVRHPWHHHTTHWTHTGRHRPAFPHHHHHHHHHHHQVWWAPGPWTCLLTTITSTIG